MPSSVSEVVADRFAESGGLAAVVGERFYPSKPTQQDAVLPYVVWWATGGAGERTLGGPSGLQPYDVRVECYAAKEATTQQMIALVRSALLLTRAQWRALNLGVQGCFAGEDFDQQTLEDGTEFVGQTFRLHFKPTT